MTKNQVERTISEKEFRVLLYLRSQTEKSDCMLQGIVKLVPSRAHPRVTDLDHAKSSVLHGLSSYGEK